jgi:hypothetical protein
MRAGDEGQLARDLAQAQWRVSFLRSLHASHLQLAQLSLVRIANKDWGARAEESGRQLSEAEAELNRLESE